MVEELLRRVSHRNMLKLDTLTASYLNGEKIAVPEERRKGNGKFIELKGAKGNNLREC